MPITIEKHPAVALTVFKAIGEVPFSEQMDALKLFYKDFPTKNVLWDFTKMEEVNISSDEVKDIIQYTKAHADKRTEGRTALVVDTELKYGLSRMASTLAEIEDTPWEIKVFENMDAAMAWISEKP